VVSERRQFSNSKMESESGERGRKASGRNYLL